MLAEVVTVILLLQMYASLFVSFLVRFCHPFDIRLQFSQQFLLRNATKSAEIITHTDILKIVQFAEDTQLTEFTDTRQEKKAEILSQPFERTEEFTHLIAKFPLQG